MTVDTWLIHFTAGAAQLPGWQVTSNKLRRRGVAPLVWYCPLMAQWNVDHPEEPSANSHAPWMHRLWGDVLDHEAIVQIMDASDFARCGLRYGALAVLRARLFTACHLAEGMP